MRNRDAREDERCETRAGLPRQSTGSVHLEIARAVVADARCDGRDQHQAVHCRAVPGVDQTVEIGPHALDPDRVRVVNEERRVAQLRKRLCDAASGIEQFAAFVRNGDLGRLAGSKMVLDLIGKVMDVDDRFRDVRVGQTIEHLIDQRRSGNRDERLRPCLRQGPHPLAFPGGEHKGAGRALRGGHRRVLRNSVKSSAVAP